MWQIYNLEGLGNKLDEEVEKENVGSLVERKWKRVGSVFWREASLDELHVTNQDQAANRTRKREGGIKKKDIVLNTYTYEKPQGDHKV